MGITKLSTHLHPAHFNPHPTPPTSSRLISTSTHLSATPSTIFEPKHCTYLGNFPKFRPTNQKLSILTENWHTWYIGGLYSKSRLRFLKFGTQNPFLGKFGPKNSKLSVLSENWCTQYLKDADSESRLRFLKFRPQNPFLGKFGPKNSKLSVLSENWYTWYLKDADSYSNISFLNFKS